MHDADGDRAKEIAGEFYPSSETVATKSAEPGNGQSERDEQLARICELARRLGFNDAKTKMLIGQSAGDLAGLERKLLTELDDQPRIPVESGSNCHGKQPKKETSQANDATTPDLPAAAVPGGASSLTEGFLF